MQYVGEPDFKHDEIPAIGVLLTNVGTPDAPERRALRRYLKQFLGDPRVIEYPRALWWLILNGIILNTRPQKSAQLYRNVWTPEGSPLLAISRRQEVAIAAEMARRWNGPVHVALGMGYGNPSVDSALESLRKKGCRKVLVAPLFPQYSGPTVGSTFDGVAATMTRRRWVPELRFAGPYFDRAAYIRALAGSIREYWAQHGPCDRLLLSFHGLPKRYVTSGDPYMCHCLKTTRLLKEALGAEGAKCSLAFQSRFGREEWLKPYCVETLEQWAREAPEARVDIVSPGFSADCLETLEELAMTNRENYEHAGGKHYRYIPALNDRADHIAMLCDWIVDSAQGWFDPARPFDWDAAKAASQRRVGAAHQAGRKQ